ncbi:MAG TPA: hypothetical protein DCQ29_09575 [Chitinophagaceae bacterium]|nr:hypothetical protein [Chitinophagaceae bacterium]
MHIFNRFFLSVAMLGKPLYQRLGVHIPHLEAILRIKLTMDDRRPTTVHQTQRNKKDKPISGATLGTMLISTILGCMFLFGFAIGNDMVTHLTVFFTMFIFMLASTLISDFTSVLIDVRDNYIIMPKPVSDITVVTARLLHIFIHVCKLVLPMSLPGLIYIGITQGILALVPMLPLLLLATLFTIFLINAIYIFILKVTTPQKFQGIISWIQIVFAILIYAAYQVLPRLIGNDGFEKFNVNSYTGIIAAPSYWFAAAWQVLMGLTATTNMYVGTAMALVLPPFLMWIVAKFLAPSFNRKLSMISGSGGDGPQVAATAQQQKQVSKKSFGQALARWACYGNPLQRWAFNTAWAITGRSKDFMLKVYPSIGYILVYAIIIFMRNGSNGNLTAAAIDANTIQIILIMAVYSTSFVMMTAIQQMQYSDKFKAAWVYYTTPIQKPGDIVAGMAKAVVFKFYIPIVALMVLPGLYFVGVSILPNLMFGLFNVLLIAAINVKLSIRSFPFTQGQTTSQKSGSFIRSLILFLIPVITGFGHYALYHFTWVIMLCMLLSIAAFWLVFDSIRRTPWHKIFAHDIS